MNFDSPFDPAPDEYGSYYENYLSQFQGKSIAEALTAEEKKRDTLFAVLTEENASYRYAPGKWSVKEVLVHCIDTERIFSVRALMFLRGEKKPIPGYDQDEYAANSQADQLTIPEIYFQAKAVRNSTRSLFESIRSEGWMKKGVANNFTQSVRAIGRIIPGHNLHHYNVLMEKYELKF